MAASTIQERGSNVKMRISVETDVKVTDWVEVGDRPEWQGKNARCVRTWFVQLPGAIWMLTEYELRELPDGIVAEVDGFLDGILRKRRDVWRPCPLPAIPDYALDPEPFDTPPVLRFDGTDGDEDEDDEDNYDDED